jgi:hypothetical protein
MDHILQIGVQPNARADTRNSVAFLLSVSSRPSSRALGRAMMRLFVAKHMPMSLVATLVCGHTFAAGLTFAEAHRLADAQPHDVASAYEEKWDAFNNRNKLDEKNGCYQIARDVTQQVLLLDKTGLVTYRRST